MRANQHCNKRIIILSTILEYRVYNNNFVQVSIKFLQLLATYQEVNKTQGFGLKNNKKTIESSTEIYVHVHVHVYMYAVVEFVFGLKFFKVWFLVSIVSNSLS